MSITAQAAVARIPAGPLAIEAVEIEEPGAGEVLVRIAGVGLCHTDLVFGEHLGIMKAPAILGHEGSGIVERVGPGVTKVSPGDHVVATFNSCGACVRCADGHPAYCFSFAPLNYGGRRADGTSAVSIQGETASAHFFGQSSFASYALANERNVVAIDQSVPLELMGPLGCGIQTGAASVMNALACRARSSLLVLGGGAVGLSAVMGAVIQGCETIIVAEPKQARRDMALELGATHVVDPLNETLPEVVRSIVPHGVDYAFDTTGLKQVIEGALSCLSSHAKFGLVGVPPKADDAVSLPINHLVGAGISVVGIIEGDAQPDDFIPRMVALYKEGRFPFDRLITRYRLSDINQAIADQLSGKCIKPVMIP
ncbi:NAD(P)-dependent alcohol dehydrogenase [Sphingobium sp. HBC34]|uniref:NAD(P)-dependent alcohol dehydrogenase n=1 Tax=Sphingobium cyanobacteriorum TaxID=3063954 RepID=A0ABT8ZQL5_9SPHN|nr:NAD(P)-dependent alcohol dehydrogenase [Sphingobium sp. HBC34]MDO7836481.1 NAD(P)-dependent alcohol dehydrogenase [Sphingobium sp. HBC34]